MTSEQHAANLIRDRLVENAILHHLEVELLWAAGTASGLTIRIRHRNRVLTLERGGAWWTRDLDELASELAHELIAEALGNQRELVPPAPVWRRLASQAAATTAVRPQGVPAPTPTR